MIKWLEHPEYVSFMKEYIPGHQECEIREAFYEEFGIKLTEAQIGNFKTKHKLKSGTHGGQFVKGFTPYNKGKKMSAETYQKVKGTMFKKGNIPKNHREVGSERITVDGYVEIKVAEPNKWKLKSRVLYEQYHNITLKSTDVIIFLDRNKFNFQEDNLIRMSRSELVRYNQDGLYSDDPEKNMSAVLLAKLKAKIGEKRNGTD
jgi:hypothetical protein